MVNKDTYIHTIVKLVVDCLRNYSCLQHSYLLISPTYTKVIYDTLGLELLFGKTTIFAYYVTVLDLIPKHEASRLVLRELHE